jgi:hypothetical protein
MPRYYFDIYDGEQSVADEDGMELATSRRRRGKSGRSSRA